MKFTINKEELLDTLQKVNGPTTTKQNFPILNSVRICTEKNKLKFTTTDLDTTIIAFQEALILEEGSVAIPMKRILSIVRELPLKQITVETRKNILLIKCEKIEFKVNILNEDDFPKIEEEKKASLIKLNPEELEEMIKLTSFCVGQEETKYVLGGILFEVFENTLRMVSTDGRRMSFIERRLPATQPDIKKKISFILPIKAAAELYNLLKERREEIFLSIEENKVGFDFNDAVFFARPIEGEFPDYSQYIPKESKNKLVIGRQDLMHALKRSDLLSTPDYQGVKVNLKKENTVISKITPQLGEVKEEVFSKYDGQAIETGFNPQYLIDVLKNLEDEDVSFEFSGADKPAVLRKENYIYLVLPMNI
ncbi:MAG: DNA polymerase III subunit beta [Candidatus Omnitrophota bacterium]|nr:DNA polymerase III subunit beta [Candidatus Omnitrophota bacterium]